ncbi:diacylglycerol kinase family lipid kinase [candidate division KSB1 bacterium]|nr:diacylglycerol kinase family lipid kinase [candidate division KSB1 bacterium]
MGKGKRIQVIYNANAGLIHPIQLVRRLINFHFPKNLCHVDLRLTKRRGHASDLAKFAVQTKCDIIIAIGGDGTINEIASELVNTRVWFGIIPMGSGNGFARSMGIPLNLFRAFSNITRGEVKQVDVALANDRYFFTTSGFGLDAMIGKRFDEGKIRGAAPYYVAGMREIMHFQPSQYEIRFGDKVLKRKAILVAVANMKQYGINAIIAPHAKPDDGELDLCIVSGDKLLPAMIHLPKLFTGQIDKAPHVELYRHAEFKIIREKAEVYHLDGEVIHQKEKEINVSVLPKALNLIVNPKPIKDQL